jgi:cell filamentation protein, protein adenylyltransferase
MTYQPPYTITPAILTYVEQIGEALGRLSVIADMQDLRLRRINRIRTLRGSLAIEGNTLSEEQISTILDGKTVIAPPREVQEVRNAIKAYDEYPHWDPTNETDLLKAHEIMCAGLLDVPGHYRSGGVGVMGPTEVIHVAPPANRVPELMGDLLGWLKTTDEHALISSCVFHYEFEFIHPFEDGNGRLGRLWQTLILTRWNPHFSNIPVESMVYANQSDYYKAISKSSKDGQSTAFIEFMLKMVFEKIRESKGEADQDSDQVTDQVKGLILAFDSLRGKAFSASELMAVFGLSHRPTFRKNYLHPALAAGLIEMTIPDKPNSRNQKYRLSAKGTHLLAAAQ